MNSFCNLIYAYFALFSASFTTIFLYYTRDDDVSTNKDRILRYSTCISAAVQFMVFIYCSVMCIINTLREERRINDQIIYGEINSSFDEVDYIYHSDENSEYLDDIEIWIYNKEYITLNISLNKNMYINLLQLFEIIFNNRCPYVIMKDTDTYSVFDLPFTPTEIEKGNFLDIINFLFIDNKLEWSPYLFHIFVWYLYKYLKNTATQLTAFNLIYLTYMSITITDMFWEDNGLDDYKFKKVASLFGIQFTLFKQMQSEFLKGSDWLFYLEKPITNDELWEALSYIVGDVNCNKIIIYNVKKPGGIYLKTEGPPDQPT